MKNYFSLIYLSIIFITGITSTTNSQVIYDNKIDSMKNLITLQSISKIVREMSGDTVTTIGGLPYRIISRYWESQSNPKAAQYIYEKFQSYGVDVRYQNVSNSCVNVIGKITGTAFPNKYYIVCGHYDNFRMDPIPSPLDTVPGADDNASSVSAVLEAAKLLANYPLRYSVLFVAFDEEERGIIGSRAFVDSAIRQGMDIIGVINMEVLGYDSNDDGKSMVITNNNSVVLANYFLNAVQVYQIGLNIWKNFNGGYSDHFSFWLKGFKAITHAQCDSNFTPYEHTKYDTYDKFNQNYFLKMVKAAFVTVASLATDNNNIGIRNLSGINPEKYILAQNYPNPFNPSTEIKFSLPLDGFVSMKVYNILGIEVETLVRENLKAGEYSVSWDASGFPGGVYFYTINTNQFRETKRMILLK